MSAPDPLTAVDPADLGGVPPLDTGRFARSRAHQRRAHALVPGGAHTYARGDDQWPEAAPVVIARGEGCRVWDVDGNPYVEYGSGLRAVTLGHAHPAVTAAARRALDWGAGFVRPHAVEVEAAEAFLACVPGADMVKFCKDGSDATSGAVRLARAATGRVQVALCADHPFFSQDDWFVGTTPMDAGVPEATKALVRRFPWGDVAALEAVLAAGDVACVVMEPARGADDPVAYLRAVRAACDRAGTLLVFDEVITGFRWHLGGAQTLYGVLPDLSAFGKALANGFSVSALCGRREWMERGGLRTECPRVFLLSSTHGAETHALAAAVETMRVYREEGVVEALHRQGARLRAGVEAEVARHGLGGHFGVVGRDCNLVYATRDADGRPSQGFRTLFLQELVRRGVLAPSFVVTAAHADADIDQTVEAVGEALAVYAAALDAAASGRGLGGFLHGRPVQPAFRRHC